MKILYFIDSRGTPFPEIWVEGMKKLGHEIFLLSFYENEKLKENCNFIKINSKFPGHRLKFIMNYFSIKKIIKKINPDIIHAIEISRQGLFATLINKHPIISTAIGSDIFIYPKKNIFEKKIVDYCFKHSNKITTMADHMTSYIKKNFRVKNSKIITFPWGCNTEIFFQCKRKENSKKNIKIICTRGMNNLIYNQELIIKSIPEILKSNKNIKFIFTGDGIYKKKYEMLCKKLNILDKVNFLGWRSPFEIAELLRNSTIFISPSKSDGNNISLNEAMACGCFPICTDIPANRQWIENGKNGYLVDCLNEKELAEKIILVLKDEKLRSDAKSINLKIVDEKADWNKQLKKMEKIYFDTLKK